MSFSTIGCTRAAAVSAGILSGRTSIQTSNGVARFFPSLILKPVTAPGSQNQARYLSNSSIKPTQLLRDQKVRKSTCLTTSQSRFFATSPTAPSSTAASQPISAANPDTALSWNTYLSLRQKRRYYNLSSSIIAGFTTFAGGLSFLMTQDLEQLSSVLFGFDPAVALGFCGLAFGTLGWLTGPFAGEAVFRTVYRRVIKQMEMKEKDFYHRIKKYRCDPSTQSVSNPVPDYYGEKISSVKGYRQWLKDQRAFRKKRETPAF